MTRRLTCGEWLAVLAALSAASVLLLIGLLVLKPESAPAIVYLESQDWNVTNGTAYDRANMDLKGCTSIVVPLDAIVEESNDAGEITILMRKTLNYKGHAPKRMSIVRGRHLMGCAWSEKDGQRRIGTYGEWDSFFFQGGASLSLTFHVPKGVQVERDATLSGADSVAGAGPRPTFPPRGRDLGGCYWYAKPRARAGWTPIQATPDLESASQYGR